MKSSLFPTFACSVLLVAVLCNTVPARGADYSTTVSGLHPLVYYHFNETAPRATADIARNRVSLGSAAEGFYLGTPDDNFSHPVTPGAIVASSDACASFPGAGYPAGISIPYSPELNPATPFSVEDWVNPAAQIADNRSVFTSQDA